MLTFPVRWYAICTRKAGAHSITGSYRASRWFNWVCPVFNQRFSINILTNVLINRDDKLRLLQGASSPFANITNGEVSFKTKVIKESRKLTITQASTFVVSHSGDVELLLRELIESGKATATGRDPQNITLLHWAAVNAHVAACRYLLG